MRGRGWRDGFRRLLRAGTQNRAGPGDLKGPYVRHVETLARDMPHEAAMEAAVGGAFATTGRIEADILRHYGLRPGHYLIDVGCGSGRLAQPLAGYLTGRYLGLDLVPALVDHARRICNRPDWRFEAVEHIAIPEEDSQADMVCFFSVLTHMLHEQSYWYLEEARRVLKPGGAIIVSFLEFAEPGHWPTFLAMLEGAKARRDAPLNVFIERGTLRTWAERLGLSVQEIRDGGDRIASGGELGQAVCVLRKAAPAPAPGPEI